MHRQALALPRPPAPLLLAVHTLCWTARGAGFALHTTDRTHHDFVCSTSLALLYQALPFYLRGIRKSKGGPGWSGQRRSADAPRGRPRETQGYRVRWEPSSRPPRPVRCLQSLRLPFSTGPTTRTRRESPRERLCEFILSKSSAMSRWEMQVGEGGRAVDMRLPKRRFTDDEVAEQARKVRAALFPRVRAARMRAGSHTVPGAPARRTGESSRARGAGRRASAVCTERAGAVQALVTRSRPTTASGLRARCCVPLAAPRAERCGRRACVECAHAQRNTRGPRGGDRRNAADLALACAPCVCAAPAAPCRVRRAWSHPAAAQY